MPLLFCCVYVEEITLVLFPGNLLSPEIRGLYFICTFSHFFPSLLDIFITDKKTYWLIEFNINTQRNSRISKTFSYQTGYLRLEELTEKKRKHLIHNNKKTSRNICLSCLQWERNMGPGPCLDFSVDLFVFLLSVFWVVSSFYRWETGLLCLKS